MLNIFKKKKKVKKMEIQTPKGYTAEVWQESPTVWRATIDAGQGFAKEFKFDVEPDGTLCDLTYSRWELDEEERILAEKKSQYLESIDSAVLEKYHDTYLELIGDAV